MPVVIEKIISAQRSETDAFMKIQKKRLAQLQAVERRMNEGKRIQKKRILDDLRESGILDEDGNVAEPYSWQE